MSSKNRAPQAAAWGRCLNQAAGGTLSPAEGQEAGGRFTPGGGASSSWPCVGELGILLKGISAVPCCSASPATGASSIWEMRPCNLSLPKLVAFARQFPSVPPPRTGSGRHSSGGPSPPLLLAPSSALASALPPHRDAPRPAAGGRINSDSSSYRPPSVHLSGPFQESGIDQTCWH